MANGEEQEEYLVRGALLQCNKGSHRRRLNLPKSHGVYINEHPMIKEDDYKEKNISFFGVCGSSTPPEGAEVVRFAGDVQEGSEEPAMEVQGKKCMPNILEKWKDVNGQGVTTKSYLVCTCGGIIEPMTSGQEYED